MIKSNEMVEKKFFLTFIIVMVDGYSMIQPELSIETFQNFHEKNFHKNSIMHWFVCIHILQEWTFKHNVFTLLHAYSPSSYVWDEYFLVCRDLTDDGL